MQIIIIFALQCKEWERVAVDAKSGVAWRWIQRVWSRGGGCKEWDSVAVDSHCGTPVQLIEIVESHVD